MFQGAKKAKYPYKMGQVVGERLAKNSWEPTRYNNNKEHDKINNFQIKMNKYGFVVVSGAFSNNVLPVLFKESTNEVT